MEKLLLFWFSCGVSIEQQILLSIRSSRNVSQDRKQNSQTSQDTQFANFVQGILPTRLIPSCFRGAVPRKTNSTLVTNQPFPRLHCGVRYNTVYIQYSVCTIWCTWPNQGLPEPFPCQTHIFNHFNADSPCSP